MGDLSSLITESYLQPVMRWSDGLLDYRIFMFKKMCKFKKNPFC